MSDDAPDWLNTALGTAEGSSGAVASLAIASLGDDRKLGRGGFR